MTRDMELVRAILFAMEAAPTGFAPSPLVVKGYDDQDVIGHHIWLMEQGGLLTAHEVTCQQDASPISIAEAITWDGHEFLGIAREPVVWSRGVELAKRTGSASFKVLMEALTKAALERLGL